MKTKKMNEKKRMVKETLRINMDEKEWIRKGTRKESERAGEGSERDEDKENERERESERARP